MSAEQIRKLLDESLSLFSEEEQQHIKDTRRRFSDARGRFLDSFALIEELLGDILCYCFILDQEIGRAFEALFVKRMSLARRREALEAALKTLYPSLHDRELFDDVKALRDYLRL